MTVPLATLLVVPLAAALGVASGKRSALAADTLPAADDDVVITCR